MSVSSLWALFQAYWEFFILNEASVCSSVTAINCLGLIQKSVKLFDSIYFMVPSWDAPIGDFKGFAHSLVGTFESTTIVDHYDCTRSKIQKHFFRE